MTGSRQRFGTFGGVFVPNILTILGVIILSLVSFFAGETGDREALVVSAGYTEGDHSVGHCRGGGLFPGRTLVRQGAFA